MLRRAARVIFEAFVLRSFKPGDPILAAVEILRFLYRGERRALPTKVPVVFLRRRWRERVRAGTPDFDPRAWEVAVLVHLHEAGMPDLGESRGPRRTTRHSS